MENEETKRSEVQSNQETDTPIDYISAINEMKKNTVSKESYDKLKKEHQDLFNAFVNGANAPESANETPKPNIKELRENLFGSKKKDLNNLDFVTNALELRTAIIEQGGNDPFVPISKLKSPTTEDYEKASRVAEVLQECVDYANGDPNVFVDSLNRKLR